MQEIERSKSPRMAKAQAILKDLRRRRLYRLCDEFTVPDVHKKTVRRAMCMLLAPPPAPCSLCSANSHQPKGS